MEMLTSLNKHNSKKENYETLANNGFLIEDENILSFFAGIQNSLSVIQA